MPRVTVYIDDQLASEVRGLLDERMVQNGICTSVSGAIQEGLRCLLGREGRPERSERGRTETLRAIRAARDALGDVEATLTQAAPVRRRVRRYSPPAR